jgi:ABC-type Na+ transport system ATPase subunit NatA
MRVIAGLDEPTSGSVLVNAAHYRDAQVPMAELGILLEAKAVHTSRSAYNHLLALAQTNGVPRSRVAEVIELVGLQDVARKRAGQPRRRQTRTQPKTGNGKRRRTISGATTATSTRDSWRRRVVVVTEEVG